jgi:hypothetical protein
MEKSHLVAAKCCIPVDSCIAGSRRHRNVRRLCRLDLFNDENWLVFVETDNWFGFVDLLKIEWLNFKFLKICEILK